MAPALRATATAWQRPRVRRTVQVGTVGAVLVATLVPLQAAQAAPERVLQSVAVQLGPDGSVSSIQSQSVRNAGQDGSGVDDATFDPAADAEKLPVRVQTAYRVGGRSGTDLRDIEGEEGRVVIDVTVSNTTVRPQLVEYDTGSGTTARDYALVGAPLTVVGSVGLATDDLTQIVTADDTAPDQVTNGVVSPAPTGGSQVQWAAMLAPPRLAPSTTFRLVQQTSSFEVPTFDFSVQPGLRTDTSLGGLLDTAFSDADGGSLDLQSRTISLVGDVNVALTEAGSVLGDIQSTLDDSASDLGDRTIRDLQAGRGAVETNLTSAVEQLDALDEEVGKTLESNSDDVGSTLASSIDDVRAQLGDPNDRGKINLGFSGGCTTPIPQGRRGGDVLYQVRLVGAQLDALAVASEDCAQDLKQGLRNAIGVPGDDCLDSSTALCALDDAATTLQENRDGLAAFADELKDAGDSSGSINTMRGEIEQIGSVLAQLQMLSREVGDGGGTSAYDGLTTLIGQMRSARDQVNGLNLDGVTDDFGAINGIAAGQLNPGLSNTTSAQATADALVGQLQLCPDAGCKAALPLATKLQGDLANIRGSWEDVRRRSDVTQGDLAVAIKAFNDQKAAIVKVMDDALTAADQAAAKAVSEGQPARQIADGFASLYSRGASTPPAECAGASVLPPDLTALDEQDPRDMDSPPGPAGPFNDLVSAYLGVVCNNSSLGEAVDFTIDGLTASLDEGKGEVLDSADDAEKARLDAEGNVDRITKRLGQTARSQGDNLVANVRKGIQAQRVQLNTAEQQAMKGLDALTKRAVERIGSQVGQSNRDLESTNVALQRDLTSVLLDLGTRDGAGSGLLGTLATSARRTGLSNANLADIGQQASAFSGVRGQQLADLRLQQEQTDQSLDLLSRYPGFGLDLPRGSSVTTVYTFHLGGK